MAVVAAPSGGSFGRDRPPDAHSLSPSLVATHEDRIPGLLKHRLTLRSHRNAWTVIVRFMRDRFAERPIQRVIVGSSPCQPNPPARSPPARGRHRQMRACASVTIGSQGPAGLAGRGPDGDGRRTADLISFTTRCCAKQPARSSATRLCQTLVAGSKGPPSWGVSPPARS